MDGYLVVRVGRELYALPLDIVREVRNLSRVTPLPGAPGFVRGLTNIDGSVVAVVDLGSALGFSEAAGEHTGSTPRGDAGDVVVIESRAMTAALTVSTVIGVRDIARIEPPLDDLPREISRCCAGTVRLGTDLATVLDDRLLPSLRARIEAA